MLTFIVFLIKRVINYLQMFFISQEISIAGIHKKCFQIMVLYIIGISFLDIEKIFIRDILFIGAVTFPDISLELRNRGMQVDQEFRLHQLLVDDFKETLIKPELIFRERYFGKQQAFGKKIIRYSNGLEHIALLKKFLLLLKSFGHKK